MKVKRISGLALGILAAVGGFVDMGGVITSSQAGAQFRYALLWTLVPGVIGFAVYADMAGRVAISSGRTLFDVIRDRLGARLALIPLIVTVIMQILTLFVELAGMALALQLAFNISYLLWIPVAALLVGIILWKVKFAVMDNGAAILGLTMLVIVVAMFKLAPPWGQVGIAIMHPAMSTLQPLPLYLFSAISLLGAYMTPYQFIFYSSGALEEEWGAQDYLTNRVVTLVGTSVGAIITLGLIIAAAQVLYPHHRSVNTLADAAHPAFVSLGIAGLVVFIIGTFAVSLGAGLESALSGSYSVCQFFGWDWGKKGTPRQAPMFHLIYIILLILALVVAFSRVDPIQMTILTMAVGAISLPFTFIPLLIVANDREFMGDQCNTRPINIIAGLILALLLVVTLTAIPLIFISGSL